MCFSEWSTASHTYITGDMTTRLSKQSWKIWSYHKDFWSWMFILGRLGCSFKNGNIVYTQMKLGNSNIRVYCNWMWTSSSNQVTLNYIVDSKYLEILKESWMVSNWSKVYQVQDDCPLKTELLVQTWVLSKRSLWGQMGSHTAPHPALQQRWGNVMPSSIDCFPQEPPAPTHTHHFTFFGLYLNYLGIIQLCNFLITQTIVRLR